MLVLVVGGCSSPDIIINKEGKIRKINTNKIECKERKLLGIINTGELECFIKQ
jgi:hypothetical protein